MHNKDKQPPISKPQYYGYQNGEHLYVIKLKRNLYPMDYPKRTGIWIGITIADDNRSKAKQTSENTYNSLNASKIQDIQSFKEHIEALGYFLDSVD